MTKTTIESEGLMPKYEVEYEIRDDDSCVVDTGEDEYDDEDSDMFRRDMADLVREKIGEHFAEIIVTDVRRAEG